MTKKFSSAYLDNRWNDLKVKNLGEFTFILEIFLGCESIVEQTNIVKNWES